jgi:CubicO group peptidase (beta-lactamase class C family)
MLPYSIDELYEGLARTELVREPGSAWDYSNLNYALLGHALERAGGKPFARLVRDEVFAPLGMEETGIEPGDAHEARLASGYWPQDDAEPAARPRWRFGEVAAFGGVYSSVHDLARFVRAQYADGDGALLDPATRAILHAPVADVGRGRRMAVGWFVDTLPGIGELCSHGGEVDSFSACIAFSAKSKVGVVVLCNRGGNSAELVCRAALQHGLPLLLRRNG